MPWVPPGAEQKPEAPMNNIPCLGIDIAQRTFVAVLRITRSHQLKADFFNSAAGFAKLERWLRQHLAIGLRVGIESTNTYAEALAEFLHAKGHTVFLLNPERTACFARSQGLRNKTDPVDAASIAAFVAQYEGSAWRPASPQQKQLRELTRVREQLKQTAQQLKNQAATAGPLARRHLLATLRTIARELRRIFQQLRALVRQHAELRTAVAHLQTVKGIGELTAIITVAELPPVLPDTDPRALCAWVGLTPHRHQSGLTEWSRLSRRGNAYLRNALFMPALVAKRHNPLLHAFALRLAQRGKSQRAILGAVAHKLLRILIGLLRSNSDFDPNFSPSKN